jgi:hypothetical protein
MRNGCGEETKRGRNKQARLFLIIGGFFNECVCMLLRHELERMWKEAVRAKYKALPGFCLDVLG